MFFGPTCQVVCCLFRLEYAAGSGRQPEHQDLGRLGDDQLCLCPLAPLGSGSHLPAVEAFSGQTGVSNGITEAGPSNAAQVCLSLSFH